MPGRALPWTLTALRPDHGLATAYPGVVADLELQGFRRIGGLHARFHSVADREALVTAYAAEHQEPLRLSTERPETVLAAPDHTAFAGVDWFWEQPSVRLRTLLTDGGAVETQRAWDRLPPWPETGRRYERHLDLRAEQDHSARGRRFAVVEGDDVGLLWRTHRAAVAEAGTPRDHRTIDQAALLWAQLMHHDLRSEARAMWAWPVGLRWRLRYAAWWRPRFRGTF